MPSPLKKLSTLFLLMMALSQLGQEDCQEDPCPDGDGDGICDDEDRCPGWDDAVDMNADGLPDACEDFVRRSGTAFTLADQPFHFVGSNTYYLMTYAADPNLRPYVDEILEEAALRGERVIRTWAFNDGDGWNALQTAPGVYDEAVFEGLDYVIWRAHGLGLRVILSLVNNWDDYGGMMQYVQWSETATLHDDFYIDAQTQSFYQDYLFDLVNRVNTFSGNRYADESAIFAWELANEPRCASDHSGTILANWVHEMADYLKSIDPNHLITTGSEGFYDDGMGPWYLNGSQGYDFIEIHSSPHIDYATAHNYPDHWSLNRLETLALVESQLLDSHQVLNKPFILGEFGKLLEDEASALPQGKVYDPKTWGPAYGEALPGAWPSGKIAPAYRRTIQSTALRDAYFDDYFSLLLEEEGGGAMYWVASHDDYPNYDGFGVYDPADIETVLLIEDYAAWMRALAYP